MEAMLRLESKFLEAMLRFGGNVKVGDFGVGGNVKVCAAMLRLTTLGLYHPLSKTLTLPPNLVWRQC